MAHNSIKEITKSILLLDDPESGLFKVNHIFEPEFHLDIYAGICEELENLEGAFQIGKSDLLLKAPQRGIQPIYSDDETEPETLSFLGMLKNDGSQIKAKNNPNICALKSISIRSGYIDFDSARCVSKEFYFRNKEKAGVKKNDVLINSTGDGTIGRVAIYNEDFPALVDGHITILRFSDEVWAWYIAAYLLSDEGQKQIYRYINGSSGQVEIYPQDISRIWIRPTDLKQRKRIAKKLKEANNEFASFRVNLRKTMHILG